MMEPALAIRLLIANANFDRMFDHETVGTLLAEYYDNRYYCPRVTHVTLARNRSFTQRPGQYHQLLPRKSSAAIIVAGHTWVYVGDLCCSRYAKERNQRSSRH